ncbi:MAG: DUF559 domain-containing protein [Candidatus Nomurabacteria bacterium]|nr:MAG: DUF559 domain-containing protein [Candidatus Nomurabacteria bacterium]
MRYLPYNKALRKRSQEMRKVPTKAEKHFWNVVLPKSKLGHYRWNRQKPLLQFIVDFYYAELKLVIEIDGDIHQLQCDYDRSRDEVLASYNLQTIRFTNETVLNDCSKCILALNDFLL